jgi:two-component system response regulator AtoC
MSSVLIIDDDEALCRSLEIQLTLKGHTAKWATSAAQGLSAVAEWTPDLVLLDLKLPDGSGIDVLNSLQESHRGVPVVMITGQQDMKATIEAMRSGAFDYIRKPFELDDVLLLLEKVERFWTLRESKVSEVEAISALDEAHFAETSYEIVGADNKIVEVVKQIGLLSRSQVTVLIEGESGTGKELVARALHQATTPGKPFVAINCSALVPTLPESELFGHEKGAFTGADARKIGKLEFAGDGTAFFDEIGDMSLDLQAKILRVLQEHSFERVGGLESIPLKARTIAATNRDLNALAKEGEFREDLYYRLAVSRITLPPLRERRRDIPMLVHYLINRIGRRLHRPVTQVEEEAVRQLTSYDWPGNVRELENVLTRALALARGETLSAGDVELSFGTGTYKAPTPSRIVPLKQAEKEHIERALISTGWNITHTARLLHISPTTLRKKIKDCKLANPS